LKSPLKKLRQAVLLRGINSGVKGLKTGYKYLHVYPTSSFVVMFLI